MYLFPVLDVAFSILSSCCRLHALDRHPDAVPPAAAAATAARAATVAPRTETQSWHTSAAPLLFLFELSMIDFVASLHEWSQFATVVTEHICCCCQWGIATGIFNADSLNRGNNKYSCLACGCCCVRCSRSRGSSSKIYRHCSLN